MECRVKLNVRVCWLYRYAEDARIWIVHVLSVGSPEVRAGG